MPRCDILTNHALNNHALNNRANQPRDWLKIIDEMACNFCCTLEIFL